MQFYHTIKNNTLSSLVYRYKTHPGKYMFLPSPVLLIFLFFIIVDWFGMVEFHMERKFFYCLAAPSSIASASLLLCAYGHAPLFLLSRFLLSTPAAWIHSPRASALKVDWEKNPLPHQGIEPVSVACSSDALPAELHPYPLQFYRIQSCNFANQKV